MAASETAHVNTADSTINKNGKHNGSEDSPSIKLNKIKRVLSKSQKVFGVEFAPISVPWERRKQTLAVISWISIFFVFGFGGFGLLLYIFFYTRFWILPILYLLWIYWDRETCNRGGRTFQWARNCGLWRNYRNYFPIKLIKTAELDPKKNYLLCSHPHGILSSGAFCSFGSEGNEVAKVFPGIQMHILTLPLNFWLPFYREFNLSLGFLSCSKESMNYLLSYPGGGKGALLVPGGAPESLESHPGHYVIQLKKKKGFIKVALQNGSSLVPILAFGELEIFDQVANPPGSLTRRIQEKMMELLSFAPALFTGRGIFNYSFGLLPRRHPIFVVVGAPIDVKKTEHPTQEQIDTLHEKYMHDLLNIYETYKDQYAIPGMQLAIV